MDILTDALRLRRKHRIPVNYQLTVSLQPTSLLIVKVGGSADPEYKCTKDERSNFGNPSMPLLLFPLNSSI